MATSLQTELDLAKEVLVYHAVVECIKALKSMATSDGDLMVMSSGFGQEFGRFKIVIYSVKKWHNITVQGMKNYITEKYVDIVKTKKEFNWYTREALPDMLYLYNFYTNTDPSAPSVTTSKLVYHSLIV